MTISVIIPTYNNLELFKRALSSVVGQTRLPMEIIVTDDSKTNEIEKYVNEIDNSIIRYYHNNSGLGAVNNWNLGLKRAQGDLVIVLHHDEELGSNDYIEKLLKLAETNDLIISDIRVRTPKGERLGHFNGWLKRVLLKVPQSQLCVNSIGPCACVAVKKSIVENFDPSLIWIVDTEWYYRLMRASRKTIFSPELVIVSNHGHSDQITSNIDIPKKNREDKKYLREKYNKDYGVRIALLISNILGVIRRLK